MLLNKTKFRFIIILFFLGWQQRYSVEHKTFLFVNRQIVWLQPWFLRLCIQNSKGPGSIFDLSLSAVFQNLQIFCSIDANFPCPLQYLSITVSLSKNFLVHLIDLFWIRASDFLFHPKCTVRDVLLSFPQVYAHTEKSFRNRVNPNQIWIVITIFR